MAQDSPSLNRSVPLRDRVYETLEELIIYGALAPGQHLVEADIAKQLGVSRIPVREGLQLLARDGWVDLRHRQGAFVHQPEMREVDDVFSIRTLLEVESTRLAARKATDDSVRALRKIQRTGSEALARADERELVMLNSQFHARITRIGENEVLAGLIARLDKRIRWYFAPVVKSRGSSSWKEHLEIVEAIAAKDPARASEAMRRHAEATRSAYSLEKSQGSPRGDRRNPGPSPSP
ncbi:MAG: FCD domain-containing protein [Actinobacteria bacterium]|nr:FCD domain-containing protein [Actinomycetota bacterium]